MPMTAKAESGGVLLLYVYGYLEMGRLSMGRRKTNTMTKDLRIQNTMFTDRLNLKIISLEDDDFIKSLVNSKGWIENIGDRNIHSKQDALAYIDKILNTENFYYWVARIEEANKPIGIISFLKRSYLENFDIGFAFLPDFNNKGYAYEAASAVLTMVSKLPEFNIVLATTLFSNESSIKLLTKLGFRFKEEIELDKQKVHIYTNASLV
jgi:[ribosomal protein S5]-alanine N-acetyltransferase